MKLLRLKQSARHLHLSNAIFVAFFSREVSDPGAVHLSFSFRMSQKRKLSATSHRFSVKTVVRLDSPRLEHTGQVAGEPQVDETSLAKKVVSGRSAVHATYLLPPSGDKP